MKSIIDFITEKQNFLIKGHTKAQAKKDYAQESITLNYPLEGIVDYEFKISRDNANVIKDYLKGKNFVKSFTIAFQNGYIHIFRYEDMKSIQLSLQATKHAEWPNNWNDPTMYTMNNMSTASKVALYDEFIEMLYCEKAEKLVNMWKQSD